MKRRDFISSTAVAAAMASVGATRSYANTKWTSGGLSPEATLTGEAAARFVQLVDERTSGEVQIQHFYNSQLGTTQEMMENTATGVQQLVITSGSAASSLVPSFGLIDTAFLFRDHDHFTTFMNSDMGGELKEQMVADFGVRMICSNWFALPRYLLHRSKFIESADDMVGEKIRTPNLPMFIANYEAMQAAPISVAYTEQYFAIRQGLIDMTESAADRILAMKLHEVAPYITVCDMMYPQTSVYVNEMSWQSLSADARTAVTDAANEVGDWISAEAVKRFETDRQTVISEGAEFREMPTEARVELSDRIAAQQADFESRGLIPTGWMDRIRAL